MYKTLVVNGTPKLYLSEPANDLWIREIVFPNRRGGYFVEAGAADGINGSSCCMLEAQFQWRGICIEPHSAFFRALTRNRPNSFHENVCLANESGWVDFASCREAQGLTPHFSGIHEVLSSVKRQGARVLANSSMVRKEAATLVELLRKYHAPNQIEYGAFDVEGSEYEALRSFPFDEYRFLAFSFEMNSAIRAPLTKLLEGNGYRETINPFNKDQPWESYFVHETIAQGHPLKSRGVKILGARQE